MEKQNCELHLPDGSLLQAVVENNPEYPCIAIYLTRSGNPQSREIICFAEYNSEKPKGHNICIGAYSVHDDEPTYYESYFPADKE